MKNYNISFRLDELQYKSKDIPVKSGKEIADGGVWEDNGDDDKKNKIDIQVLIPKYYTDINNIVHEIHDIYSEALAITHGGKLNKITVSFEDSQEQTSKVEAYVWSDHVMQKMEELEDFCKSYEGELRFSEIKSGKTQYDWSLQQVKKANSSLNYLINFIEKSKLSPYEAIVFLADWTARNIWYMGDPGYVDVEMKNSIMPVFIKKQARCFGFSSLAYNVLSNIDFSYLHGASLSVRNMLCSLDITQGKGLPNHCQSLVSIVDPKYDINGDYILDLTGTTDNSVKFKNSSRGERINDNFFLSEREETIDNHPNYRFISFADEFRGEEYTQNYRQNPTSLFVDLKNKSTKFLALLGVPIPEEKFKLALSKVDGLEKQANAGFEAI